MGRGSICAPKAFSLLALGWLCLTPISQSSAQTPGSDILRKARDFMGDLVQGKFDEAQAMVDPSAKSLTADEISSAWKSLQVRHGAFQSVSSAYVEKMGALNAVSMPTQFENGSVNTKLVFNASEHVVGLFFSEGKKESQTYVPPASVDPSLFTEQDYTVTNGDFRLPGTLTLPKSGATFIVVVLLTDSGPNDRDETIGPNKPLRDIAWGLAARGIASLRYDKRTLVYGTRLTVRDMTYRDEVVDDAVEAIQALRKDDRFNRDRIFVLGHGLAGQLAPAISQHARRLVGSSYVAGAVIMAGPARPLVDLMIDHLNHIAMEDGDFSLQERSAILNFQSGIEAMIASGNRDSPPVMGITYTYLKALNDYDGVKAASKVKIPLFIAQGERDCQVTVAHDFQVWQDGLANKKGVAFHLYPKLNHLFIAGEGTSYPSEYEKPGHVSEEFLDDVATWLKSVR